MDDGLVWLHGQWIVAAPPALHFEPVGQGQPGRTMRAFSEPVPCTIATVLWLYFLDVSQVGNLIVVKAHYPPRFI
jgi:hypothetical protein